MKNGKLFLLLDVDGVLLEAHGYCMSYVDTANALIHAMGQRKLSVDRLIWETFEAGGIRAEWDMVPLTIAAFVNWYILETGEIPNSETFPPDCSAVSLTDQEKFRAMLIDQIHEYCEYLDPALPTMDALYQVYRKNGAKGLHSLRKIQDFDRYFVNTLHPDCPFFAELMVRLLGTAVFEEFFSRKAPFQCPSYLATKDIPLLSEENRKWLPEVSGRSLYPVIMTYRPTRLPKVAGNNQSIYFVNTPEGECALQLLGWDEGRIPMIGLGSLCYSEEKYGMPREFYCKPHAFHGLASVALTLCGDQLRALEIAHRLCEFDPITAENPLLEWVKPDEKLWIAVFEDSITGIECAENTAEVLRRWGFDAESIRSGIRTNEVKNKLLENAGAMLFDDINLALDHVLKNVYFEE